MAVGVDRTDAGWSMAKLGAAPDVGLSSGDTCGSSDASPDGSVLYGEVSSTARCSPTTAAMRKCYALTAMA